MFCAFHKKRLAYDTCSFCQTHVCSDCRRVVNGKVYCSNCISKGDDIRRKKYLQQSPTLALLLAIFPGLGQVYNGQLLKGLVIFFTCWLVIPWLYGMYDAYATACRINEHRIEVNISPALFAGCLVLVVLLIGFFIGGPFFIIKAAPQMIQNFLGGSSEAKVKRILEDISGAAQEYKKDHGVYPQDVTDLYFGEISYLSEMYCNTSKGHYQYDCKFDGQSYEIIATPLKAGFPGYRMTPGPVVEKF